METTLTERTDVPVRRDAINSRDTNNCKDARNVGYKSSRKYINGSSQRLASSGAPRMSTAEQQLRRYTSNSRDHYNSWDPR